MNIFSNVPAVTADEVNQAFTDGLGHIANGVWEIISPFAAAAVILWLLALGIKAMSGRRR